MQTHNTTPQLYACEGTNWKRQRTTCLLLVFPPDAMGFRRVVLDPWRPGATVYRLPPQGLAVWLQRCHRLCWRQEASDWAAWHADRCTAPHECYNIAGKLGALGYLALELSGLAAGGPNGGPLTTKGKYR